MLQVGRARLYLIDGWSERPLEAVQPYYLPIPEFRKREHTDPPTIPIFRRDLGVEDEPARMPQSEIPDAL